ncbi:MAG: hypothetical protein KDJ16_13100 [Hyphomicrobiales bacterium]|nr:hypothetical protein [Hyphomicrobiales bacterium]
MIESIMYLALGALAAAVAALIVLPFVVRRAARLERRRIERAAPLSLEEIRADKDQLRAQFAVSVRRLEYQIEELELLNAEQLIDINQKRDMITELITERDDKQATILELEDREREVRRTVLRKEEEVAQTARDLRETQRTLDMRTADLRRAENELASAKAEIDGQKVELIASSTRLETVRDELSSMKTRSTMARTAASATPAPEPAVEEKAEKPSDNLQIKLHEAEAARIEAETQIAALTLRLETKEREHEDAVRERDETIAKLTADNASLAAESEKLRGEMTALDAAAATAAGANGANYENLRESIRDFAAEVTHMTAAIEGENSPIEQALAADAGGNGTGGNGKSGSKTPQDVPVQAGELSIADRVRALKKATANT